MAARDLPRPADPEPQLKVRGSARAAPRPRGPPPILTEDSKAVNAAERSCVWGAYPTTSGPPRRRAVRPAGVRRRPAPCGGVERTALASGRPTPTAGPRSDSTTWPATASTPCSPTPATPPTARARRWRRVAAPGGFIGPAPSSSASPAPKGLDGASSPPPASVHRQIQTYLAQNALSVRVVAGFRTGHRLRLARRARGIAR